SDGKTAVLGAPKHNLLFGGVYAFTADGSKWTQSGSVLGGRNELRNAELGVSISVAADGRTVAVGGPGDNSGRGAVWIFTRRGPRRRVGLPAHGRRVEGTRALARRDRRRPRLRRRTYRGRRDGRDRRATRRRRCGHCAHPGPVERGLERGDPARALVSHEAAP